ncbi:MAG: Gfo/Idh/MocA family oxidoreductase [Planctomycetes bacterium]|nr:Gfo/Idh/MocA family oxidoreductase [Planctomycetota bacterium]
MDRRDFLKASTAALGLSLAGAVPAISLGGVRPPPSERIQVAVAGVRGRGNNLLRTFADLEDVDVRYVCDVDGSILDQRVSEVKDGTRQRPEGIADFRRALDDKSIDALVLGTPDHWHAIPTILACQAGKDVYTEKPDGHNVLESFTMVAAARKHQRIVQLGTQTRSAPFMKEAIEYIRKGSLGKVRYATSWESQKQGSLGRPADREPPPGVDYDLWLGPAPKRPFNPLRFHGNWRWFFDYGTGDLGNDGVHRLDYARWALEAALEAQGEKLARYPLSASAQGGKYYFDDAQEWPDTLIATFDYGNCLLSYELRIWSPYPLHGAGEGAAVYGDKGHVVLSNSDWKAYGEGGKLLHQSSGGSNLDHTEAHARDFLDCMRSRKRPAADLETVGHPSSLLCHLGNASWRSRRTLSFDPESLTFRGDSDASQYLTRPRYREPWRLPAMAEV